MNHLRKTLLFGCVVSLATGSANAQQTSEKASAGVTAEMHAAKASLEKYQDPIVAVRDGFLSTQACIGYADGNMGVHFINLGNIGSALDPQKPQVLIYEPVGDKLQLVAAEWFVPLEKGMKEAPSIFGRKFDGPMDGHQPVMPKELTHYDLHVWLWKPNPAGVFNTVNSTVDCGGYGYTFIDKARSDAHFHKH